MLRGPPGVYSTSSISRRKASIANLAAQFGYSYWPYAPETGKEPLTPPRVSTGPLSRIVRRTYEFGATAASR
jgi:hypothetical protein